jgi:hypothetical protein
MCLVFSPPPEFPAACRSEAEISYSEAAGMNGESNRIEACEGEVLLRGFINGVVI